MQVIERQPESLRAEPERTCAGCRRKDAKGALLRFVVRPAGMPGSRLVPDVRGRLPGRGVSVHPRHACLKKAVERGGFARAIRGELDMDLAEIRGLVLAQYAQRANGLLVSARRVQRLAIGTDATRDAIRGGNGRLVVIATDAAGRRREIESFASQNEIPSITFGTKETLGQAVGRSEVGVLAISDTGIASEVAAIAALTRDLSEAE